MTQRYYTSTGGPQHLGPSVSHRTHNGNLDLLGRGPSCRRQRPSGEAIRSSHCTTPDSAPSGTTCCAGRTLHSRSAGSGSACAPGPHRVLAALPRRHYAPPEARHIQKQRHLRGPWATSHAPPEQERQRRCTHSSDTAVLKKASLVFMSQPYDGSMPARTAGGNLGLTWSPTRSHPASLFFATQYIIRTRRR
jgi:hypothetical protein